MLRVALWILIWEPVTAASVEVIRLLGASQAIMKSDSLLPQAGIMNSRSSFLDIKFYNVRGARISCANRK